MAIVWRKKGAWTFLLLFAVASAIGFLHAGRRQTAAGKKILLANGNELTLYAVTFGCDHTVKHGALSARMLERVPGNWLPKWKWIRDHQTPTQIGHAVFSEPHLVLWFVSFPSSNSASDPTLARKFPSPTPPRVPRHASTHANNFLRWKIIAPDGSEHGGTLYHSVGKTSYPTLFPMFIDSYPRRLAEFTVQLFEPTASGAPGPDAVLIGEFRIRTPKPGRIPAWTPEPLPARKEDRGVECVLNSFTVSEDSSDLPAIPPLTVETYQHFVRHYGGYGGGSSGGNSFRLRDDTRSAFATFDVLEKGSQWEVRQFRLTDPTGNTSFATSVEWQLHEDGRRQLTCGTIPLWPDDPAWKIQLDLVRSGNPPSNRIVRLLRIPFPPVPGSRQIVAETNILGHRMRVHAVGMADQSTFSRRLLVRPVPSLEFEFDRHADDGHSAPSPMLHLVDVKDEAGKPMLQTSLHPDTLVSPEKWCLDFLADEFRGMSNRTPVKFIDLTLGFMEQRRFEFFVKSGWVKTTTSAVPRLLPKPQAKDFE